MAKATLIYPAPTPPEPTGVTLRMSMEEAEVIRDLLAKVGGDPKDSRRGLCNAIYYALCEAGVPLEPFPIRDAEGSVWFTPIFPKEEIEARREAADKGICSGEPAKPQGYTASGGWAVGAFGSTKPPIHRS